MNSKIFIFLLFIFFLSFNSVKNTLVTCNDEEEKKCKGKKCWMKLFNETEKCYCMEISHQLDDEQVNELKELFIEGLNYTENDITIDCSNRFIKMSLLILLVFFLF